MKPLLLRAFLLLALLSLVYLFFFLLPQRYRLENAAHDLNLLTQIQSRLLQNHLAFREIKRLDLKAPNFEADQSNLLALIETSRSQTLNALTKTPKNLRLIPLIEETKKLLESQPELIENYRPDFPAVAIFTKNQSDLLSEYQTQLTTLKTLLSPKN